MAVLSILAQLPHGARRREDEIFYLLEGSVLFKCGDELFEAGPGAFVFLPRVSSNDGIFIDHTYGSIIARS